MSSQGLAWKRQSEKLGVTDDERLSVLADGAKWIWDQARQCWSSAHYPKWKSRVGGWGGELASSTNRSRRDFQCPA